MTMVSVLTVSDAAAEKAKMVLEQRGKPSAALRLFVAGGGCSGPQYGMALAEEPETDDTVYMAAGVTFLIDPESLPYVTGAEVDYVEDTMRSGFTIFNPNVQSSGGCGGKGVVNHVGRYHSDLPRLRSGIYVYQRRAGFLCQPRVQ